MGVLISTCFGFDNVDISTIATLVLEETILYSEFESETIVFILFCKTVSLSLTFVYSSTPIGTGSTIAHLISNIESELCKFLF